MRPFEDPAPDRWRWPKILLVLLLLLVSYDHFRLRMEMHDLREVQIEQALVVAAVAIGCVMNRSRPSPPKGSDKFAF